MTFQRKMLFGFSLMVLPAVLIGVEAIRTNVLERDALQMLGQNMARTRTRDRSSRRRARSSNTGSSGGDRSFGRARQGSRTAPR